MDQGREHYIIGRALYEAIIRLERLPETLRPGSDIDDMIVLLDEKFAGVRDMLSEGKEMAALHGYVPEPVVKLVPKAKPSEEH